MLSARDVSCANSTTAVLVLFSVSINITAVSYVRTVPIMQMWSTAELSEHAVELYSKR